MIMENMKRNYNPSLFQENLVSYKNIVVEKILGFQVSMPVTIILAIIFK
jgi:hypothetical protein